MRTRISSGSKWEPLFGYSRAVVVDRMVFVSGTVGVETDGSVSPDVQRQAQRCLEIISSALAQAGASVKDVVRTRVYLTNIGDFAAVAAAHAEVFSDIRPATTALEVSKLVAPNYLVEIEADAVIPADSK